MSCRKSSSVATISVRLCVVFLVVFLVLLGECLGQAKTSTRVQISNLPLVFEPAGSGSSANFVSRRNGVETRFSKSGIDFSLAQGRQHAATAHLRLMGANDTFTPAGQNELSSKSNYLIGSDPKKWRTHVPNFARVKYSQVYPGIDLLFYGTSSDMEHDFVVAPGADPGRILFELEGVKKTQLGNNGDLQIELNGANITFKRPVAYQQTATGKTYVQARFVHSRRGFHFELGSYDHTRTLVIDPVLTFSTYLADLFMNTVAGVATDGAGNTYVAGIDFSPNYPTTQGAFQPSCASCSTPTQAPDVFVTKLSPDGTSLVYSTFLGGSGYDQAYGIAVDANGNAVVAGRSESTDFPLKNAQQHGPAAGISYGFLTSLSADGSALNYSTLLGGAPQQGVGNTTIIDGVALDSQGNAYVGGTTDSPYIAATPGAMNAITPAYPDSVAFVSKFLASGTPGALAYTALIGDTNAQNGGGGLIGLTGIAVNGSGEAYITGNAGTHWTTTSGAYQTTIPGTAPYAAVFVAKLAADASQLAYSTFIGSDDGSYVGIALDGNGDAFITGGPVSSTFPTTANAYLKTLTGTCCASFFSELDPTGHTLLYSSFFGSSSSSFGLMGTSSHIAIDAGGNIWLAGWTGDGQFPLVHPIQTFLPSSIFSTKTGFISRFDPTGQTLTFSTYFGDLAGGTEVDGLAIDPSGKAHIDGFTGPSLYTTPNAHQPTVTAPPPNASTTYDFAAALDPDAPSPAICMQSRTTALTLPNTPVGTTSTRQFTVTNCGSSDLNISGMQLSGSAFALVSNSCLQAVAANGSCSFGVSFTPAAAQSYSGGLTIVSNAPIPSISLSLTGLGTVPKIVVPTGSVTFDSQFLGQTSPQQFVFIQNGGLATLLVDANNITISSQFAFTQRGCDQPILPSGSCVLFLTFTPISAGTISGTLTIPSNDPTNPLVSVPLSGVGYSSYPAPSISAVLNPNVPVGSTKVTVQISGTNFFQASVVKINGIAQSTQYTNSRALQATLDDSLFTSMGNLSLTVSNPAPGGGDSAPVNVVVYRSVAVNGARLVYEPHGGLLWASIPSTDATSPNSVVSIDPATGKVGTPISVGNNPRALALSDDGQYLYVGLDGDHAIQRVNLSNKTVEKTFALPTDSLDGTLTVYEMHVVPGANTTVVASLFRPGSPAEDGIALFNDSGLVNWLPNDSPGNIAVDSFVIAGTPPTAYSLPLVGSPQFFSTYTIDSSGIRAQQNGNFVGAGGTLLAVSGNSIYTSSGQIWDLATKTEIGNLNLTPFYSFVSVVPDDLSGSIFFLNEFATYSQYQAVSVDAYDQASQKQVGSIPFLNIYGPDVLDLIRWGQTGFAFLVNNLVLTQTSGQVVIFTNGIANPTGPAASVSPNSLIFSSQLLSTTSKAQSINLTNSGNADMTVSSINVSGDFHQTNTCPQTLPAGASCAISVAFTPSASGSRSGTLSVTDNAPGSPHTLQLSGTGIDFSLTAGNGAQLSATVQAGGTATYNLTITPTAGVNGTFAISCAGTPLNASCSVTPNQIDLSSGSAQPFTVSVNTNSPGTHSLLQAPEFFRQEALLACILPAVWFMFGRRKNSMRRLKHISRGGLIVLAIAFAFLHIGCGGGGNSTNNPNPPGNNFTPAGTYTLTVSATQANVTRSINLTLVVH